jgi:hypothetical protein
VKSDPRIHRKTLPAQKSLPWPPKLAPKFGYTQKVAGFLYRDARAYFCLHEYVASLRSTRPLVPSFRALPLTLCGILVTRDFITCIEWRRETKRSPCHLAMALPRRSCSLHGESGYKPFDALTLAHTPFADTRMFLLVVFPHTFFELMESGPSSHGCQLVRRLTALSSTSLWEATTPPLGCGDFSSQICVPAASTALPAPTYLMGLGTLLLCPMILCARATLATPYPSHTSSESGV